MPNLNEHPTVVRYREKQGAQQPSASPPKLDVSTLRKMCLDLGADDAGFVEISRTELAGQREDILAMFPWTKTLISLIVRINRENLRSPARSIASLELHHAGDRLDNAAYALAGALERMGVRAVTPPVAFPMEMDNWLGKMYLVSHKPIAVAAGLGVMGLHRNVIHPVFGSYVLLNTLLIDAELDEYGTPLDYSPCLGCKLCAAACPTGAIEPDGSFTPINCLTHSYRELLGGFTNWVEKIADSRDALDYRQKASDAESVSMWQSLAYGPCYKSVYCLAVCPAGEDVIPQYLADNKQYVEDVVRPLQRKEEPVYVLPGSDAERHVQRVFPHKKIRRVDNGIRPPSIAAFLALMPRAFQRHQSEGLNATYHFTFTGEEQANATVRISNMTLEVKPGHEGTADVRIVADTKTWLRVLHKDSAMITQILLRRIRVKGPLGLFKSFGKCFP
ncbi:MAG TPA: SCP2 sterol-binding domain-containing protein [Nitrospirota bacterium]|nr:SCP2 sterol-binding domain-containing protein [Nitrospirota bacterium]